MAIAFAAGPAEALDKCKAGIDRKDGTIYVDAGDIDGTLLWSYGPFDPGENFAHDPKCLSNGKAKKCTLAPAGNQLRNMAPSFCTLYLRDDSDTCEPRIQGCAPASRPVCPLDMQDRGGWCIDDKANALASGETQSTARILCIQQGRSLCPTHLIMAFDGIDLSKVVPNSCGDLTDDPAVTLWTERTHARAGENTFNHLNCYKCNNELASDAVCTAGALFPYFCCMPHSGL